MSEPTLLSIRGYAKHRGCTEGAVRKAIERGKITAFGSGKETRIDPASADVEWAANTRVPARRKSEGAHPEGTQVRTDMRERYAREIEGAAKSPESKAEAERRKEIALANIREHEERVKTSSVVDRQAVVDGWFTVCRAARDQALGIRDRLIARLFLTPEQADVVREELQLFLTALSKEVPAVGAKLLHPPELP
jgi:hypothetical protein